MSCNFSNGVTDYIQFNYHNSTFFTDVEFKKDVKKTSPNVEIADSDKLTINTNDIKMTTKINTNINGKIITLDADVINIRADKINFYGPLQNYKTRMWNDLEMANIYATNSETTTNQINPNMNPELKDKKGI